MLGDAGPFYIAMDGSRVSSENKLSGNSKENFTFDKAAA